MSEWSEIYLLKVKSCAFPEANGWRTVSGQTHLGEHASSLLLVIPVPAGSSLGAAHFQQRPYCPGHWLSVSLREPGAWEWCLIHWSLINKTAANSSWDGPAIALDKIKGAPHKWAHPTFKPLSTFNHGFLLMIPIKRSKKAPPSCSRAPS